MQSEEMKAISQLRMSNAFQCLKDAQSLLDCESYKASANRSYYAVFHAMRAVLIFDGFDSKKHSGIISEFRRKYIKDGIFSAEMSVTIRNLFSARTHSDYDDFFVISKEEVAQQLRDAEKFVNEVNKYLESK